MDTLRSAQSGFEEVTDGFASDLTYGKLMTCLWNTDEKAPHRMSTISVVKEVWNNVGTPRPGVDPDCAQYPVFHVYNYADPSKGIPFCGCRVNPYDEPYLTLEAALKVAMQHEQEAIASGKWKLL